MVGDINKEISGYILNLIYKEPLNEYRKMNVLNISYDISNISSVVKEKYKYTNIYNIELVKKTDETISKNLELIYEKNFFDFIILNGVIDSLVNVDYILGYIKEYLKDDGYIIANVPNVMNYTVMKGVLNGSFTYSNEGILDKKSIRFFTLLEIQKLFDSNKYNLNSVLSVKTNDIKEYEHSAAKLCGISNEFCRDQYLTYNYIVKASKKISKTLSDFVLNY